LGSLERLILVATCHYRPPLRAMSALKMDVPSQNQVPDSGPSFIALKKDFTAVLELHVERQVSPGADIQRLPTGIAE
jgi:hypothetical protein